MKARFSIGSRSQPSLEPLAIYSSIFSFISVTRCDGERSSMTKSGQISVKLSFSPCVNRSHRLFGIHDPSGERFAPFGNVNPAEESKNTPVPSRLAQIPRNIVRECFLLNGQRVLLVRVADINVREAPLLVRVADLNGRARHFSSVLRTLTSARRRFLSPARALMARGATLRPPRGHYLPRGAGFF